MKIIDNGPKGVKFVDLPVGTIFRQTSATSDIYMKLHKFENSQSYINAVSLTQNEVTSVGSECEVVPYLDAVLMMHAKESNKCSDWDGSSGVGGY